MNRDILGEIGFLLLVTFLIASWALIQIAGFRTPEASAANRQILDMKPNVQNEVISEIRISQNKK